MTMATPKAEPKPVSKCLVCNGPAIVDVVFDLTSEPMPMCQNCVTRIAMNHPRGATA